jgi:HAD superfamily hydrolase (TIGR01509 family)
MTDPIQQTLIFDLGNVVVFFSLDKMVEQLAGCMQIRVQQLRKRFDQHAKVFLKYERGLLSSQEIYQYLRKETSHLFTFEEMMWAMSNIFTPNIELWPLIEKLKADQTKLVLLSNTNECHFNFVFSHYPILKLFDRFILSYEVKACKPDPLIFEQAQKEARGKTFYTDDIPAYVQAGRAAGLDAEVFIDVPTLQKQLQERRILHSK